MPLKNYTTKVPADRSLQEIQVSLVKHGATGVLMEYEKGTGRIASLKFKLDMNGTDVAFRLPIDWRKFQSVLVKDRVSRANDEDYVYRVSWRCLRDWVLAQMALYETQMVDLQQVFLPYAMANDGRSTLYERVLKGGLLLPSGSK
jgi:hypothetical protein